MSEKEKNSFYTKSFSPYLQAGVCFGLFLLFTLGGSIFGAFSIEEGKVNLFPWDLAASFTLFYAVFNSVFSLSTSDINKYWTQSFLGFIGLAGGVILISTMGSGTGINDAASYRWIFIVLVIGYLIFMSMMRFMRRIVDFAQKEEWNNPRLRRRR